MNGIRDVWPSDGKVLKAPPQEGRKWGHCLEHQRLRKPLSKHPRASPVVGDCSTPELLLGSIV